MIEYLLSLSFLIVVLLLIRGIFRKTVSPRAIYALWLVVVIRMLLPITMFEVDVKVPEFLQNKQTEQAEQSEQLPEDSETTADVPEQSATTSPIQITPIDPSQSISPVTPITPTVPFETTPVEPITPETNLGEPIMPGEPVLINWKQIADLVWFSGAVIAAVWVILTTVTYNRSLYKDRKLHRTVQGTKVYISESAGVPCIAGFIPSIYITPEAANSKSEMLIIVHEHVHLRHGDHIWSIIRALALIVFWWNPFVWVAATVSKQDAELACDDAISANLNDDGRLEYANILLDTIPQKHRYAVGLGSAPMKERILMLTEKQKNRWICLILTIVLALSAVGCSFVSLNEKPSDNSSNDKIGIVTENLSDFLTEEQIALYEKAGVIYPLFNGVSDSINILHLLLEGASVEEQILYMVTHQIGDEGMHELDDGTRYCPSYGEYDTFDEFKELCVSAFTEEYFEDLNQGSRHYSAFLDYNDKLYYIDAAKGNMFGYAPDEFPDEYELVEMSDEVIVFNVTGHYKSSNVDPDFTITEETFTVRMVLTENGWRFSKFAKAGIDDPPVIEDHDFTNTPTLSIPHDSLHSEMERIEENELFPAEKYSINVTGMSVPVKLYMQLDSVAAIEAHGQYVEIKELFDIYGNCSFKLFESGGAVIIEGGYYEIGDVYIISPERCSEMHPGTGSSYWLHLDDSGSLKYLHKHNGIANIMQTGALSVAVAYDEFLFASGDASIKNGELFFAEPTESYTMSDRYDLDEEFRTWYSGECSTIEEKFAKNLSARNVQQYGQGPFIGYVADKETPWITLHTSKTGTYVGRIPYEIFNGWPATQRTGNWKAGYIDDYTHFYYAEFGDFRWAGVHIVDTVLGSGRKNIATSTDGGKTWTCGSYMDDYGGNHVISIGFLSRNIAYMTFHPDNEPLESSKPAISRTEDGGKTWERLNIQVPDSLKGYKMYAYAPERLGDSTYRIPVVMYDENGVRSDTELRTYDMGYTWRWQIELTQDQDISFETKTVSVNDVSMVSVRVPARWVWNDSSHMFNEKDKLNTASTVSIKRAVIMKRNIDMAQLKEELSYGDSGFNYDSPITGTTDKGYSYEGFYGDISEAGRYIFLVNAGSDTYTFEVWTWHGYDGDSFFDDMVMPILNSFEIQQTLPHQAIMENKSVLYDVSAKKEMLLSDHLKTTGMSISKYSVIDLDKDADLETVLWLTYGTNEYVGFLVLHSENNNVYAHGFTYRGFYDLKEDGTFHFSSGVSNNGSGKIDFSGDTYTINKIAYCESDYNENVSYYVENKSVSKEEFDAYESAQSQKPNAVWYDYTFGS